MWKNIDGWEDYYEINECGDVRNKITNKMIIGDTNSSGYKRICLYNKKHNPTKQRFFRHRLVAKHFLPNPYNLPEVNHKDHNLNNNHVSNLEWCTRIENEIDSRKYGTKEYKPYKVQYTNGEIIYYDTAPQLAETLNVTRKTVKDWILNKTNGYKKYNIVKIEYI